MADEQDQRRTWSGALQDYCCKARDVLSVAQDGGVKFVATTYVAVSLLSPNVSCQPALAADSSPRAEAVCEIRPEPPAIPTHKLEDIDALPRRPIEKPARHEVEIVEIVDPPPPPLTPDTAQSLVRKL